jgi:hypothetical protein
MLDAMKALYRSPLQLETLPQKPAVALERAGLVHATRIITARGAVARSPNYSFKLTKRGLAFCKKHYGQS